MTSDEIQRNVFSSGDTTDDLGPSARVAVKDVLKLKKDERVLIITNPPEDVRRISMALFDASLEVGASPILLIQPVKTQLDLADRTVIDALRSEPDVVLSISTEKLGKDESSLKDPIVVGEKQYDHIFNYLLGEKKIRSFWSPSITMDIFRRTVPIDYSWIRETALKLSGYLNKATDAHITTEKGMDMTINLKGRIARSDDGNFSIPGSGGNLPCGEVFISPAIASSEGTIMFDGSIASTDGVIVIREPITVEVKEGYITNILGGEEAAKLKASVTRGEELPFEMAAEGKLSTEDARTYSRNARHLGELGIGLNRKAMIIGNMLEDEKVFSTIHIAIGANYDEDARALIHLDGLIKAPTLELNYPDGEMIRIMKNGALLI